MKVLGGEKKSVGMLVTEWERWIIHEGVLKLKKGKGEEKWRTGEEESG